MERKQVGKEMRKSIQVNSLKIFASLRALLFAFRSTGGGFGARGSYDGGDGLTRVAAAASAGCTTFLIFLQDKIELATLALGNTISIVPTSSKMDKEKVNEITVHFGEPMMLETEDCLNETTPDEENNVSVEVNETKTDGSVELKEFKDNLKKIISFVESHPALLPIVTKFNRQMKKMDSEASFYALCSSFTSQSLTLLEEHLLTEIVPTNYQIDATLLKLMQDRDNRGKQILENLDENDLRQLYTEHFHSYDEFRLVLEGCGYYDVRDKFDEWIRIELIPGDLIVIPGGCYHRFTVDKQRIFTGVRILKDGVYQAHNRPSDKLNCRKDYIKKLYNGAFLETEEKQE
ncbi:unnamed protein product [Phaedon cochleariae]|uniref:acireductone dioxygenase (Fe(2+)-requiring) n=1 Tax=Phaedon cochleariae TaxID=80249 RepID=A0A9N9SML6_PHACE|nr:unnamed protein product [Phaedon cochleariae]